MDGYWWEEEESEAGKCAWDNFEFLRQQNDGRLQASVRHARMYGNMDYMGMGMYGYGPGATLQAPNTVSLNVISSCVDTLEAKIAKANPRPSFQTFGGSILTQKKAKELEKFCQGKFYELKYQQKARMAFRDACIFGTGVLKFFKNNRTKRVECERILIDNIFVDDVDGVGGNPRNLMEARPVAKDTVIAEWCYDEEGKFNEDLADLIRTSANLGAEFFGEDYIENKNATLLCEAWHLPSYEGAGDGRHIIFTSNAVLLREDWNFEWFPHEFIRFSDRLQGFYGQGLAERLTGIQLEINRLLIEATEMLRLMSRPKYLIEMSSKVDKKHIRGGSPRTTGEFIEYSKVKPEIWVGNVVPPEIFNQIEYLRIRAYEESGVSMLSASAKKPAGLDSGVAIREYQDSETERFAILGKKWEQFHVDGAKKIIQMVKQCYEEYGEYEVKAPGKKFLESIDWKDVQLEDDQYVQQIFPSSSLPTQPAARLQMVMDLVAAKLVPDMATARRLLEMPDIEADTDIEIAELDDVDMTIASIVEKGEYMPVEPIQDLDLLKSRAAKAWLKYRHFDVPEQRLAMLADLIREATLLQEQQAPPQPQSPMAPMMPGMQTAPQPEMQPELQPVPPAMPGMIPPQ